MRKFTIRKGVYAGDHIIYDSIEEAQRAGKAPKSPWYTNDVEPGDWCVSDDGYVLRCLKRDKLVNKRHKSGQYTDYFRFCNGTFYVYYAKGGKRSIKNFYGVASANHKSSLGNTSSLGKYMTLKKKHFVTLVSQGFDPYHAYVRAYKVSGASKNNIWVQVNNLLNDPVVKAGLMEELKPVIFKLEKSIQKETGANSLQDWLVDELTKLLAKSNKISVKDRRDNIRLIINLFGEPLGFSAPKPKNTKSLTEADWMELPPPELGSDTETKYGNHSDVGTGTTDSSILPPDSLPSVSVDKESTKTEDSKGNSGDSNRLRSDVDVRQQDPIDLEKKSKDQVDELGLRSRDVQTSPA